MIRAIKVAYGAGWRAGMAKPELQVTWNDKMKRIEKFIIPPVNPCRNLFTRAAWQMGYETGRRESIERWLASRN